MSADAKIETKVEVPEVATPEVEGNNEEINRAEQMGGLKEVAKNVEGIAIAKKAEEPKQVSLPSFFINTETFSRVSIDMLFDKSNGKILSISKAGLGVDFSVYDYLGHTEEWFDFTQPTYEDVSLYRQRSSVYNKIAQKMLVDSTQMRNFMLVWHLKDWSIKDSKGNKVELTKDDDGSLTKESMEMVYKTFPTILDVVLTIFERDIMLA